MSESYAKHSPAIAMPTKSKRPPKILDHMRVTPGEKGGATVEHHFTHYEHSPETREFGKSEGKKFAAHMMQHSGMGTGANDIAEAQDDGSAESEGNEQEA